MPTLKPPRRDEFSGNHRARLLKVKDASGELGITLPAFERAFERAEHSGALSRLRSEPKANRSARIQEVARALGREEITSPDAVKRALEIDVESDPDSAWHAILAQGAIAALAAAFEELRDSDETIITGTLRPMVAEILTEVGKLRRVIPSDSASAADASRQGEKVAAAWSRYESLLDRWNKIHAFAAQLRREGILPTPDGVDALRSALEPARWRDLLAREDWLSRDPRPVVRVLLDEVCDRWGAGIYTAFEIEEHIKAARQQGREEAAVA